MTSLWQIVLAFTILALAANQIGHYFVKFRLPLISGFLFAGILVGPYLLGLLSDHAIRQLTFVDEMALAVIAFAAGNELYLKELQSRLKSIAWVTVGLVLATFTLGSLAVFFLAEFIPFMKDLPAAGRAAVAILAGAILVARSPSSAIAVVNELRAKGPFTQMVLGVTVIMDVIVIVLFAINSEMADVLFNGLAFGFSFVALISMELLLSFGVGYVLAKLLQRILSFSLKPIWKCSLVLALGYGIFRLSAVLHYLSHQHLPFEVLLEPLLICMTGSFLVTNRSQQGNQLSDVLHRLGPPIYLVFFTLTGASLRLDILLTVWPIALVLVSVRLLSIFLGAYTGGTLAGDPATFNRISWMAFVTQAGVGLGLAKEVVREFPAIEAGFSAIIIAVIVVNQLVGPPLFKFAIYRVGEAQVKGQRGEFDGVRDVVIFGLNARSIALTKQLVVHDWNVKIATLEPADTDLAAPGVKIHHLAGWTASEMKVLELDRAESIVAMVNDDEQNYRICQLVYEQYGIETMVTLLEQLVRSPAGASLLLGMQEGHDIVDVELRNPNLCDLALRDLRLPLDVLILSINRDNQTLVSRGHTVLRLGDKITMAGPERKLQEVMLRFES
jgi:Kef-type K+ transport system membrane component KefB